MAIYTYPLMPKGVLAGAPMRWWYVCDTEAERPTSTDGCLSLALDSGVWATRKSGSWLKSATLDVSGQVPTAQLPASQGSSGIAYRVFSICGSGVAWTNQPAAVTELFGGTDFRMRIDLTEFTQMRLALRVGVVGHTTAVLRAQYSTNESAWTNLTGNLAINTVGTKAGAWETIPAGARADVVVRIVGEGGNATADPRIGTVALQVT